MLLCHLASKNPENEEGKQKIQAKIKKQPLFWSDIFESDQGEHVFLQVDTTLSIQRATFCL